MKVLLIAGAALIGVIVIVLVVILVIGSRLPDTHTASRSIRLKQPPHEVYAVVRDFASASEWRTDITSVEVSETENGKPGFRETGANGVINYELVEDVPNTRITTSITDQDLGFSGSWTYEFTPDTGGTRVTITENGIVSNIFFRFMARYIFGHTSTINTYLKSLAGRFNEPAEPE